MICITCPILHEIVCIDLKCNGYVLVLIKVELIQFVCSKCIRSIWTKTNTNIITTWKKMYSHMAIGRNDNYVQRTFTADAFRKRRKRENSMVGPKLTFVPHQKKWHNCTTVLYTKYVHNTKNYFLPEPKNTNTSPQLYGTVST
jgi:hypothetical protein